MVSKTAQKPRRSAQVKPIAHDGHADGGHNGHSGMVAAAPATPVAVHGAGFAHVRATAPNEQWRPPRARVAS